MCQNSTISPALSHSMPTTPCYYYYPHFINVKWVRETKQVAQDHPANEQWQRALTSKSVCQPVSVLGQVLETPEDI
jgi:hypothetical protein